jgi:hypothetical protein
MGALLSGTVINADTVTWMRSFGMPIRGTQRTVKDIYFKKLSHFPCKNFHGGKPCLQSQGPPATCAARPAAAQAKRLGDGEEGL